MKKQLTGMNLVTSLLALAMAVMAVVGLSIPVAIEYDYSNHVSYDYVLDSYYNYQTVKTNVFNGFNTLGGDDYLLEYSGIVAGVNVLLLIAGLSCVVLAFLAMFVFSERTARKTEIAVVITCICAAFLYMVEGFAMVALWQGGDYTTTTAPVLFTIQALLLIAYFVCNHFATK